MKAYVYESNGALERHGMSREAIVRVLERVGETTDTSDLVVSLYVLSERDDWKGFCKVGELTRADYARKSRTWQFVKQHGTPGDLPEGYQLIRMMMGADVSYPRDVSDVYGWQVHCPDFAAHLAYFFAHELHHFRRHHLGMHPGEGEQSACRWALARMVETDFPVEGERVERKRKKVKPLELRGGRRPKLLKKIKKNARKLGEKDLKALQSWVRKRLKRARVATALTPAEAHLEKLRALPDGTPLIITGQDRPGHYLGRPAVKVRTLRRNSTRMVIRTEDGQEWRWPMQWLEAADQGDS